MKGSYIEQNLKEVKDIQKKINRNYSGPIRDEVNRVIFLLEEAYEELEEKENYINRLQPAPPFPPPTATPKSKLGIDGLDF